MAKKIIIDGNYTVITDTLTSNIDFEAPTSKLRYYRLPADRIAIYADGARTNQANLVKTEITNFIDSGDTPIADIFEWLTSNTASSGGGGSGVAITQSVDNFAALADGNAVGELAYVKNSQGTKWLPGTLGGTYYPAGFYLWDGADWVSDRNAIAEALDGLITDTSDFLFENLTTTGSQDIDWSLYGTWNLVLTGITTLTESNLPTGTATKTITLYVTGDFALTLPAGWVVKSGVYDGTVDNQIVVEFIKTGVYWVYINQ